MFRSKKYPPGIFTRGRLDWNLDRAMAASDYQTGNAATFMSLYNNSTDGSALAVVALLAWCTAPMPWTQAYTAKGTNGTLIATTLKLHTSGTLGFGQLYQGGTGSAPSGHANLFNFLADGKSWIERANSPLCVLDSGFRLELFAGLGPLSQNQGTFMFTCSFVWVPV